MVHPMRCPFCQEIDENTVPDDFTRYTNLRNRFILKTDSFVIFPSISPIQEGHTLLVPITHITNMYESYSLLKPALHIVAKNLLETLRTTYGPVLIFEHGVSKGSSGGCGITHAHWHFLPLSQERAKRVIDLIEKSVSVDETGSVSKLFNTHQTGRDYLLYGFELDQMHIVYQDLPSQFVRKIVAEALNLAKWDWKEMFASNVFEQTYHFLRKEFNQSCPDLSNHHGQITRL